MPFPFPLLRIFRRCYHSIPINELKKGQFILLKDKVHIILIVCNRSLIYLSQIWVVHEFSLHTQGRFGSHYKVDFRDVIRGQKLTERFNAGSELSGMLWLYEYGVYV